MLLFLLTLSGAIGFTIVIRSVMVLECVSIRQGLIQMLLGGFIVLSTAYLSNQVEPPGYEPACGSLPGLIGDDC